MRKLYLSLQLLPDLATAGKLRIPGFGLSGLLEKLPMSVLLHSSYSKPPKDEPHVFASPKMRPPAKVTSQPSTGDSTLSPHLASSSKIASSAWALGLLGSGRELTADRLLTVANPSRLGNFHLAVLLGCRSANFAASGAREREALPSATRSHKAPKPD